MFLKIYNEELKYDLPSNTNEFELSLLPLLTHDLEEEEQFKVVEKGNEFILKHLNYTRIGDIRVKVEIEQGKLSLKIYQHYTAYIIFIYLTIVAVLALVYLPIRGIVPLALIFLYFFWILNRQFKKTKKSIEVIMKDFESIK